MFLLINISLRKTDLRLLSEVRAARPKTRVYFVGTIKDCTGVKVSKSGNEYVKFEIGDETDTMDVLLFKNKRRDAISDCISDNRGSLPAKKNIVIVKGMKSDDGIFADFVTVQDSKIYMKLGQLRNDEKNLN